MIRWNAGSCRLWSRLRRSFRSPSRAAPAPAGARSRLRALARWTDDRPREGRGGGCRPGCAGTSSRVVAAGVPVVAGAARTVAATHLRSRDTSGIAMFFVFALARGAAPGADRPGRQAERLARLRLHHREPAPVRLAVVGAHRRRRHRARDGGRAAAGCSRSPSTPPPTPSRPRLAAGAGGLLGASAMTATASLVVSAISAAPIFVARQRRCSSVSRSGSRAATRRADDLRRPPTPFRPDLRDHGVRRRAGRDLLAAVGLARAPAQRARSSR